MDGLTLFFDSLMPLVVLGFTTPMRCKNASFVPGLQSSTLIACRSGFPTETSQEIDDEADHENQAKASSSDCGATEVKAATAEQKKKYKYK